ncbi:hypothetical protein QJS10_CPB20g01301 [Acorus calamus]|uniref:Prolamin-like domain-containing protein n=1 Tax=Acorus calamus TaxID=4465 RepID=A0AAV9CAV9_ACOCL|nr:hypothetical protein QJS10_CPB20g01301 [Acorus calamus]
MLVLACTADRATARPVVDESKAFDVEKCWESLMGAEGCIQDILSSFFTGRIQLGLVCCHSLEGIGDSCFIEIFPFFSPSYSSLLKAFCAAQSGPAPSPVA